MYSQLKPSETPRTLRSEPIETATSALRSVPPPGSVGEGGRQGAEESERLQVDAEQANAGEPASLHVVGDQVAVRDDEEDALRRRAVGGGPFAEDLEVEHGLVDRDRERLLGAEAHGVGQLLRILDPRDLDGADADAVVREADPDVALGELVLPEELLERLGERLDLPHLAAGDHAGRQRRAGELHDLHRAVDGDARGVQPRGAELQTDDLLRHSRRSLASGHPQVSGRVGGDEAAALEQAPELIRPARALER